MSFQPSDVPRRYDLGIATPDGLALTVKNRDGNSVSLTSLGFVTTNEEQQVQKEASDLQRLQRLVQLSSPLQMDRQIDDWPQVSQADWSSGMGQRFYVNPSQYFFGFGLMWPTNDYLPDLPSPSKVAELLVGQVQMLAAAGGFVSGLGWGWAEVLSNAAFPSLDINIRFHIAPTVDYQVAIAWTGFAEADANTQVTALTVNDGSIWVLGQNGANAQLWEAYTTGVPPLLAHQIDAANPLGAGPAGPGLAVGMVDNREYVALTPTASTVRLLDVTNRGAITHVDLTLPNSGRITVTQLFFLGSDLVIMLTDGSDSWAITYSISSATYSSLFSIPTGPIYACPVGGDIMIVTAEAQLSSQIPADPVQFYCELYTFTGGSLIHIGNLGGHSIPALPVTPPAVPSTPQFWAAVGRPVAFGPYALWYTDVLVPQPYAPGPPPPDNHVYVWAYDIQNGRLFCAYHEVFPAQPNVMPQGWPLGVIASVVESYGTGHLATAQWGVTIPLKAISQPGGFYDGEELVWGLRPGDGASQGVDFQQPVDIISSEIDFNTVLPKLFREAVAVYQWHQPATMAPNPPVTVTLSVFVDQDPLAQMVVDATGTLTGTALEATNQLVVPINKIGRRIIYRVTTGPGDFAPAFGDFVAAPRLLYVAIMATVGWVYQMTLDLSPNVTDNTLNEQAYSYQAQGLDHVAAYNFLRGIYRQYGGHFKAYLPSGDVISAKMQNLEFASPKPVASGVRSDQAANYSVTATVEFREDV